MDTNNGADEAKTVRVRQKTVRVLLSGAGSKTVRVRFAGAGVNFPALRRVGFFAKKPNFCPYSKQIDISEF